MANPMNQHGGGYMPGNSGQVYTNQGHGGGYIPNSSAQPVPAATGYPPQQQYYSQPAPTATYQEIQSPQSSPRSNPLESKTNINISSAEVDEYNGIYGSKKPIHLKGTSHYFDPETRWRFKKPHLYQLPVYQHPTPGNHRHRDAMDRVMTGPLDDRYLSPFDGHLAKLHVQATDELYQGQGNTTWRRTYVRSVATWVERLATWPIDFSVDPQSWKDWGMVLLRFIPASFVLSLLIFSPGEPPVYYGLRYAPFAYKFHGYPKAARNQLEDEKSRGSSRTIGRANQVIDRILRPQYLCFLRNPEEAALHGADPMLVSTWQSQHHGAKMLKYLFIAYSAEQFNHSSTEDLEALHMIAEKATRAAGLPAYWVACSCMPDRNDLEEHVYRISDIMRGAEAMAIAVGNSSTGRASLTTDDLLRNWGKRMWTFPEVLLSQGSEILVYTRGGKLDNPYVVPKQHFAQEVWTDATVSRQLIDHYEGTLGLSRLELVIIALQCLQSRQTTQYLAGDHAYALMGLLRTRPNVDHSDTAFQAFARLSLMNDSDLLLERLICTLPKSPNQPWYDMSDSYDSSLWDIYPTCQVSGVGHDDSVIIDGAYGTSIRWKSFHRIWNQRKTSWGRWIAWQLVTNSTTFAILGFTFFGLGVQQKNAYDAMMHQSSRGSSSSSSSSSWWNKRGIYETGMSDGSGFIGAGIMLLILGFTAWFLAPRLLQIILGGKFWNVQAAVFGFEGYLNLPTIERAIFGGNFGRLSWSTNGSPLSRHWKNQFGECVGQDPTDDIEVRNMVEQAKRAHPGDQRIFTIIDTYSMQVTMIQAARPPIALLICGAEGGMQRAIGCSYDWTSQTLYRETVMRLPTTVLDRMERVPRFKIGLTRPNPPAVPRVVPQ